eukprot:SAG31_NODE_32318_length_357_cov_0.976744_1_plen_58_part_01
MKQTSPLGLLGWPGLVASLRLAAGCAATQVIQDSIPVVLKLPCAQRSGSISPQRRDDP